MAFTSNGSELVGADLFGDVWSEDPRSTDQPIQSVVSVDSQVNVEALSPDAEILAFGDDNGTVRLWDIATNEQIGSPIATGDGPVDSLAFSPEGGTLATVGNDGMVRLWNVSYLVDTVPQLCSDIEGEPVASYNWSGLAQGLPYRNVCP